MKSRFTRQLVVDVGIVGGSVLLGVVFATGMGHYAKGVAAEAASYRSAVSERQAVIRDLANLKSGRVKAEGYLASMETLLPEKDALLEFPGFLGSLGKRYNVDVSFSFKGEPASPVGGTAGRAPFSLRAAGDLDQMVRFIEEAEQYATRFLVHFDSVAVTGTKDGYRADVSGTVFFR